MQNERLHGRARIVTNDRYGIRIPVERQHHVVSSFREPLDLPFDLKYNTHEQPPGRM